MARGMLPQTEQKARAAVARSEDPGALRTDRMLDDFEGMRIHLRGRRGLEGVVRSDGWERLAGSYHGSGCTLSSAIAAGLAQGLDIAEAVAEAQEYTWQTLKDGFRLGMGQPIPDRLFWAKEENLPGNAH